MKQNKEIIKKYFETGDKPTQQQYHELIDSYIDAKQPPGAAHRKFAIDENGDVSVVAGTEIPQADWKQTDSTSLDYIKNKPNISKPIVLETVATFNQGTIENTSLTAIPAPGVGKFIEILAASFEYIHGGGSFTGTAKMQLNTASGTTIAASQMITNYNANSIESLLIHKGSYKENEAIIFQKEASKTIGERSAITGTVRVYITYVIKNIPSPPPMSMR
ncbi:hypothetical protein V3A08_05865 [Tenacibaculum maritimum]|uniref:hypothetical protein n=1 Tax=Tenacibaculum maritimum TaxID=107401 RepID=UPI0012E56F8A|nr:hypothetical protein [Tenacibaculum maritimum]CAA0203289.1 hypothetical protein DPIF89300162_330003 [Tenacibaculum maritimum]